MKLLALLTLALDVALGGYLFAQLQRRKSRGRGPTPPPTPSPPKPEWRPEWTPTYAPLREIVAVHEAGHTIAAWHCTTVGEIYSVSIDHVRGDTNGHVVFRRLTLTTSPFLWCAIVLELGGVAAELLRYRRVRSGPSRSDLLGAREIARQLVALDEVDPPWPARSAPPVPFAKMFSDPVSEAELRVIEHAYAMARWLIEQRRDAHDGLTQRLLDRREVHGEALAELLGPRPFEPAVRIWSALGAEVPARFVL